MTPVCMFKGMEVGRRRHGQVHNMPLQYHSVVINRLAIYKVSISPYPLHSSLFLQTCHTTIHTITTNSPSHRPTLHTSSTAQHDHTTAHSITQIPTHQHQHRTYLLVFTTHKYATSIPPHSSRRPRSSRHRQFSINIINRPHNNILPLLLGSRV